MTIHINFDFELHLSTFFFFFWFGDIFLFVNITKLQSFTFWIIQHYRVSTMQSNFSETVKLVAFDGVLWKGESCFLFFPSCFFFCNKKKCVPKRIHHTVISIIHCIRDQINLEFPVKDWNIHIFSQSINVVSLTLSLSLTHKTLALKTCNLKIAFTSIYIEYVFEFHFIPSIFLIIIRFYVRLQK